MAVISGLPNIGVVPDAVLYSIQQDQMFVPTATRAHGQIEINACKTIQLPLLRNLKVRPGHGTFTDYILSTKLLPKCTRNLQLIPPLEPLVWRKLEKEKKKKKMENKFEGVVSIHICTIEVILTVELRT